MHKELMMNMDFHWQDTEGDVLHSCEHVASSGPTPSGPCPFCCGPLNAGCRRWAESSPSPPTLLVFGPAKDIDDRYECDVNIPQFITFVNRTFPALPAH